MEIGLWEKTKRVLRFALAATPIARSKMALTEMGEMIMKRTSCALALCLTAGAAAADCPATFADAAMGIYVDFDGYVVRYDRQPDGTIEEKFALRHSVTFSEGGPFHELFGATKVMTNTLHGQGIKTAGARVIIDGYADDGTPEATFIKDAPGFSLSVQWHPEYRAATDPVSRPLFEGFGDAVREWAAG